MDALTELRQLPAYEPPLGVCDEVVVVVEAVAHAPQQALVPVSLLRRYGVNLRLEPVRLLRDHLQNGEAVELPAGSNWKAILRSFCFGKLL